MEKKLAKETDSFKREHLQKELDYVNGLKRKAKSVINEIASIAITSKRFSLVEMITSKKELINHDCYVPVVDKLFEKCFSLEVIDYIKLLETIHFLTSNRI